jgi:hypothetical protein
VTDADKTPARQLTPTFSSEDIHVRISTVAISSLLSVTGSAAMAGNIIPMPGAGVAGPLALVVAIGAVVGVKYLRRQK